MPAAQRIAEALDAFDQLPRHARLDDCQELDQLVGLWISGANTVEEGINRVAATLSGNYLDLRPFAKSSDLLAELRSIAAEDDYDPDIAQDMIREFNRRRNPLPPTPSDEKIDMEWIGNQPLPSFWEEGLEQFKSMMPPGSLVYDDNAGPGLNGQLFLDLGYAYLGHESLAWNTIAYHGTRRTASYELALRRTVGRGGTVTDCWCLLTKGVSEYIRFDGFWTERVNASIAFRAGSMGGANGGIFRRLRQMVSPGAPMFLSIDTLDHLLYAAAGGLGRLTYAEENGWKLVGNWLKDFTPDRTWNHDFRGYLFEAT